MGRQYVAEVWPIVHMTELCLQLAASSGQSCDRSCRQWGNFIFFAFFLIQSKTA